MTYFVRIRGKAFGPFDEEQLLEMKAQGKIGRTIEVSENKMDWYPAETLPFLYPSSTGPQNPAPPIPDSSRSQEPAEWYYSTNGTDGYGPVTRSAILQNLQAGTFRGDALVWKQGQNAQRIQEVPEFSGYSSQQSNRLPQSQSQSNANLFCAACGNPVVATAQICPRCGSPIARHRQSSLSGTSQPFNSYGSAYTANTEGIGFVDILTKKYAQFNGRAQRKEYWMFQLINFLITFVVTFVGVIGAALLAALAQSEEVFIGVFSLTMLVVGIYGLYIFIPGLAVTVRRLHDAGYSGWFFFFSFIPWVGGIILLVFLVQDSQRGDNLYGPNPKGIDSQF